MHDYDLDKITRKVTGLCRAKGLWPDCVKLPEAEYRAIFGENGLRGKQKVILIDDVKDLYFESGPVVCPVVHYSMSLSNADTVKDKPQPPGYRDPVISDRCGDCCRFSLAKSLGWCKKFVTILKTRNNHLRGVRSLLSSHRQPRITLGGITRKDLSPVPPEQLRSRTWKNILF
jgi:hypothetical protein